MMKNIKQIFRLFAIVIVAVACSSQNPKASNWTETNIADVAYQVVRIDSVPSSAIMKNADAVGNVVIAHITYTSGSSTLSGIVAWPANVKIENVVIGNHWTIGSDAECPSHSLPFDVALCVTSQSFVVCSDYLGFGASADKVHPYLCAIETARNSVDCFRAAMLFATDYKLPIATDFKTFNIGYSQGGAVALAVQRYVEANAQLNSIVHLEHTICGAGPYDPVACYKAYLQQDTLAYPVVIPMIIAGMKATYPTELARINEEAFFSDKFNSAHILDSVKSKRFTTDQINAMIINAIGAPTPHNLFSESAIDTTSAIAREIIKVLEFNNLTKDWQPQTPVRFFHSTDDVVVPIVNFENAMKSFSHNKNVAEPIVSNMGTHGEAAVKFYMMLIQKRLNEL